MEGRMLFINQELSLPIDEISWRFSGSGGPGGQHANTANTRVEAVFSIEDSPTLSDLQRQLLVSRYGSVLRIVVSDERSQTRNRNLALERLAERVRVGLLVPKRRTPTKPTRGSIERRLTVKRNIAQKKQRRSLPEDD